MNVYEIKHAIALFWNFVISTHCCFGDNVKYELLPKHMFFFISNQVAKGLTLQMA